MLLHMCHSSNYVMLAGNVFIIIVHDGGAKGANETKELEWWSERCCIIGTGMS